jgi:hypothetical protein
MSSFRANRAPGNERLEAALNYAAAGWPVFPCRVNSKEPATRNGFHDATTDPERIASWWGKRPDLNVAIATGAPGPDVLDVDVHEHGTGFPGFNKAKRAGLLEGYQAIVRTPSTGMHLYYAGTGQRSGKLPRQHIDFRADGGYVVAPPSAANGARYVVVKHQPEAATVSWPAVVSLLEPPQRQPARRPGPPADARDVGRLAEWVSRQEHGNRNDGLFYAACRITEAGLLDADAVERLVDAARRSGLRGGEPEARRTIGSAQRGARPKVPERDREAAS